MNKGQVSIEYAMIMGFVALITIPLIIIYYNYSASAKEDIVESQIYQISQHIVDSAESVYYLGEPSQTEISAYVPEGIVGAAIEMEKEIVFNVTTKNGISQIVQISPVNLTGSLPITRGIHNIKIKAVGNKVDLSYS